MYRTSLWATVALAVGMPALGAAQSVPSQGTVRALIIPMVAGARRPALTGDLVHQLVIGPAGTAGRTLDDGLTGYLWRVSRGVFRLDGEVLPALAAADYPQGLAARPQRALDRVLQDALTAAAASTDLSRFDNDGPDGVAGSGDDDGTLDLVIVTMEAPTTTPEAIWLPSKLRVKTPRGERRVTGVLYVVLPENGESPAKVVTSALQAAMGVPGEARSLTDGPDEPVGTLALVRLGWRETLRVEKSGVYQPLEDAVLSVPILDVPNEQGRWFLRQIGHETDLVRVFVDRETTRIVERFRVSAEHEEVTIPLTSRLGLRGARMTLTWPQGAGSAPEVSVELRAAPGRTIVP